MTDKTFPPPQALRVVPLEESQNIRSQLAEFDNEILYVVRSDVEKLVEFVEQYRPKAAPDMVAEIAGSLKEVRIIDPTVDEEQIDLVRLNGRVYAPEIIEVEEPPEGVEHLIWELRRWPASDKDALSSAVVSELMTRAAAVLSFFNRLDEDDLTQIIDDTLGPREPPLEPFTPSFTGRPNNGT